MPHTSRWAEARGRRDATLIGHGRRRRAMSYLGLTPGALEAWPAEARELAFDREEYQGRLRRVRALMAEQKVDLLYVTTPDHVCYLHGYFASWYKANSPMRYPQLYGTAIHVDHDE